MGRVNFKQAFSLHLLLRQQLHRFWCLFQAHLPPRPAISSPNRHEMSVFAKYANDINGVLPQESHISYNICASLVSRMPVMPAPRALFQLGQTVGTPAALDILAQHGVDPASLIMRHVSGDWGDLDEEDRAENVEAIISGERLMSAYIIAPATETAEAVRVWVITEAKDDDGQREATTILLPGEY